MQSIDYKFFKTEYVFCEQELEPYEETILLLAMAYGRDAYFRLDDEDINDLAGFLKIDCSLLKKAITESGELSLNTIVRFGSDNRDCTEYFKNTFFIAIIYAYTTYKNFKKIKLSSDVDEIINNVNIFRDIVTAIDIINANIATYECMLEDCFSLKYTVFDSSEFSPMSIINTLSLIASSSDCLDYDKNFPILLTVILRYELFTKLNALYVVCICQLLKHSPYFNTEITRISNEMYDNLLYILKNGRIISINVNTLFLDMEKHSSERSSCDNTTRLQIIYGYQNYDCYEMRLDFPHKDQPFIHFNVESPGKISCCLFSEDEYQKVMCEHPELSSCFISYGNRWALKERTNCDVSKTIFEIYDNIRKKKAHDAVFDDNYSEEGVDEFIKTLGKLLPYNCNKAIYANGDIRRKCFNCDKIIMDMLALSCAYFKNNNIQFNDLINNIATRAYNYGLICENPDTITSLEDICIIAIIAMESLL